MGKRGRTRQHRRASQMGAGPMQDAAMIADAANTRKPVLPEDLGAQRTIMAADRTLMAWIRTALSMLSFGFTIYKFLQALSDGKQIPHSHSPRQVGLFLVGMGILAIVLGTISYWTTLKDIERSGKFRFGRPILLMALVMCVAGVSLFGAIATKLI
jgi:putative membrane protein